MSIISVIASEGKFYINHGGEGNPSLVNSYPIEVGADGNKYVVFEDSSEYEVVLNEIEDAFGPLDLGAYCFGGDWDDNALSYDELVKFFINEAEIPVLIENA